MRSFRIVIVGHGRLPAALLASAELIAGPIEDIAAVGLHPHETPDHFAAALRDAVGRDGRAVLVLSDLIGGTPQNVAAALARRDPRLACVSGVNLGMLLEAALGLGALTPAEVERLVEVGRVGIGTADGAAEREAAARPAARQARPAARRLPRRVAHA